jgi:hypothetical protein
MQSKFTSRSVCRAPKHQTIKRLIIKNDGGDIVKELDPKGWLPKQESAKGEQSNTRPESTPQPKCPPPPPMATEVPLENCDGALELDWGDGWVGHIVPDF